ncbi:MAG TPA: alpha/beta fold hydrolase [Feifaniaceae bacterium]|nr:alpha/beta fold hydrolase [Feifaniaceae bacterium]
MAGRIRPDTLQAFDALARPYFHKGGAVGCLLMHGFTGTPANVRFIADALALKGYTVYSPMLSGHGTSLKDMNAQRHTDWLRDAEQGYEKLKEAGCADIFVLGHSMGGVLAMLLAERKPVNGVVLFCAPLRLKPYLYLSGPLGAVKPYLYDNVPAAYKGDPYAQGYVGTPLRRIRDIRRLCALAKRGLENIMCPVLLFQSRNDNRVDLSSVGMIERGAKNAAVTTVYLERSTHGCPYGQEREEIAAKCLTFVKENSVRQDEAEDRGA